MQKMKRIIFTGVLEVDEDTFAGEFNSEAGHVLVHAFEHGDAGGEFFMYTSGYPTIVDYLEETE